MKKIILALSFILLICQLKAQSVADYISAPFPTYMTASPDGKAVAWVFNDKGERNVFYAKAPDYTAKKLTDYKGDIGVDLEVYYKKNISYDFDEQKKQGMQLYLEKIQQQPKTKKNARRK